jgi:hypothetical protein
LNRAARRAGVSVGAYLADPDTGRCVNCDRMGCQPSAQGQLVLHVNTFTKKDAYAHMLERYGPDTGTWPYIPGGRPPAQPGHPAATPETGAAKVPAACPQCHRRHASAVVTMTAYAHVLPGSQRDAADRFAAPDRRCAIMTRRPQASDWHQRGVARQVTCLWPAGMSCPRGDLNDHDKGCTGRHGLA